MKATIKTVASLSGVSIMTVSRVLNNSNHVKERTRRKVLESIKKLNYHPNIFASNFSRCTRSQSIGLIVKSLPFDYFMSVYYFNEIMHGIQEVVEKNNYDLVIYSFNPGKDYIYNVTKWFFGGVVQGFIMISPEKNEPLVDHLLQEKIPFVVLGCSNKKYRKLNYIDIEHIEGGYIATKHLLDLEHRDIAFIQGPLERSDSFEREQGYRKALKEFKVPVKKSLILRGNYTEKSGFENTKKLLKQKKIPTAIFAANDLMAIGAIKAIQEKGLNVPNDISVVGFDDIKLASEVNPALTTIEQPMRKLGEQGTQLLIDNCKDAGVFSKKRIKVKLVVRQSCRKRTENKNGGLK